MSERRGRNGRRASTQVTVQWLKNLSRLLQRRDDVRDVGLGAVVLEAVTSGA